MGDAGRWRAVVLVRDRGEVEVSAAVESSRCCHSRSEEHTSELQSPCNLVCRLLLEKKKPFAEPPAGRLPHRRQFVSRNEGRGARVLSLSWRSYFRGSYVLRSCPVAAPTASA